MPALDPAALAAQRDQLRRQLAAIGDLRPGSLSRNYRRCGKPNCRCAAPDHPGHGPYWVLTWSVKGKTRSRRIPPSQVQATRDQIAECQRLRRLVADLIRVSDELCQSRLQSAAAEESAAKKKPARRPSLARSRTNWRA